jgi:hypothetical protein
MPEIPLTQGQVAIVDDEDYEFLMQWKWHASKKHESYYAQRHLGKDGKWTNQYMHRLIAERMGINSPQIDHHDRDPLNNCRSNLRPATHSQNMHNRGIRSNNTSGYTGVYWDKRLGKWVAQFQHQKKRHQVGQFDDIEIAYEARCKLKRELAGEFTPKEIKDA